MRDIKSHKEKTIKIGQHKLGTGGYSNLVAQIVSIKNPIMYSNNKFQIIFILMWCKMKN